MFKKGDIVVYFNKAAHLAANLGAIALVEDLHDYGMVLILKWLDNNSNGQMNGGYEAKHFKILEDSIKR